MVIVCDYVCLCVYYCVCALGRPRWRAPLKNLKQINKMRADLNFCLKLERSSNFWGGSKAWLTVVYLFLEALLPSNSKKVKVIKHYTLRETFVSIFPTGLKPESTCEATGEPKWLATQGPRFKGLGGVQLNFMLASKENIAVLLCSMDWDPRGQKTLCETGKVHAFVFCTNWLVEKWKKKKTHGMCQNLWVKWRQLV